MDDTELQNRFTYHAPKGDQPARYEQIRGAVRDVSAMISRATPECHEQELAIERLEEAVFWANAAIARRE